MLNPLQPLIAQINGNDMQLLGIDNTMRLAKKFNRLRFGQHYRRRKEWYERDFEHLLAEHANGTPPSSASKMEDGWLIDTSGSLPHLDELIEQAEAVIAQRGGQPPPPRVKPFIVSIVKQPDLEHHPTLLNFVLSPPVLKTVSDYLGFVPVLSTTMPPGVRLTESSSKFDPEDGGPYRESQLYHLDHHDLPLVYVIVLVRDVSEQSGPFTFLPASVSDRAARALNYRKRGAPYRITDEMMYSVIDKKEAITMTYPKGTVLFLDSSRCFHYGSRNCVVPRYQMMYAFVSPCRTDFSELLMKGRHYASDASDSRLRQMVLTKTYRG
jgi:hypothetical protein